MEIPIPDRLKDAPPWRQDAYQFGEVIRGCWEEGGIGLVLTMGALILFISTFGRPLAAYSQWQFRRGTHPSQLREKAAAELTVAGGLVLRGARFAHDASHATIKFVDGRRLRGADVDDLVFGFG